MKTFTLFSLICRNIHFLFIDFKRRAYAICVHFLNVCRHNFSKNTPNMIILLFFLLLLGRMLFSWCKKKIIPFTIFIKKKKKKKTFKVGSMFVWLSVSVSFETSMIWPSQNFLLYNGSITKIKINEQINNLKKIIMAVLPSLWGYIQHVQIIII